MLIRIKPVRAHLTNPAKFHLQGKDILNVFPAFFKADFVEKLTALDYYDFEFSRNVSARKVRLLLSDAFPNTHVEVYGDRFHKNLSMIEVKRRKHRRRRLPLPPAPPTATPPDTEPYYPLEPQLQRVNPLPAWQITQGNSTQVVAVLDSGVRCTHEDLNVWKDSAGHPGYNFRVSKKKPNYNTLRYDPSDDQGHGSWIAGRIGAVGDNSKGVAGIDWKVQIMPLKVLKGQALTLSAIAAVRALSYVHDRFVEGVPVVAVNCSWETSARVYKPLQDALEVLSKDGIVCCCSAGNGRALPSQNASVLNNNDTYDHYPSGYSSECIIGVAGAQADGSCDLTVTNFGPTTVLVAAPSAINEISTGFANDQDYRGTTDGTSAATPYVTGTVALLKAMEAAGGAKLTFSIIKKLIMDNAEKRTDWQSLVAANGLLDIGKTLKGYQGLGSAGP
jgi:subtilisin family serine protease